VPALPAVVVESGATPTPAPGTASPGPAAPALAPAAGPAPGDAVPGDTVPGTPATAGGAPAAEAAPAAPVAPAVAAAPADSSPAAPGQPATTAADAPVEAAVPAGRTTAPPAGEPAEATGASPSVGVAPTGGTAAAVSVAGVELAAPPRDLEVASQLARQLAVLRNAPDGTRTMVLHVTPDELGPVSIEVTVGAGSLELTLRGAHDHGRAALLDAVPDLRRELETAGLSCTRLDVDRDPDAWSGPRQDGRPDQLDGDPRGSGRPDTRSGEHGPASPSGRDDVRRARPLAATQPAAAPLTTAGTAAPSGVDVRV
jgi:flagellar hook-length control protein FliK